MFFWKTSCFLMIPLWFWPPFDHQNRSRWPENTKWSFLMFVDVCWCLLMFFDGFWCFLMFFDGLYIMEDGLEQVSHDHHLTTKIDQKASKNIKKHQKTSTNIKKDQQKRPPKIRRPLSEKTTKDQMTWKHQMVFFDVCWCFLMFVDVFWWFLVVFDVFWWFW